MGDSMQNWGYFLLVVNYNELYNKTIKYYSKSSALIALALLLVFAIEGNPGISGTWRQGAARASAGGLQANVHRPTRINEPKHPLSKKVSMKQI